MQTYTKDLHEQFKIGRRHTLGGRYGTARGCWHVNGIRSLGSMGSLPACLLSR